MAAPGSMFVDVARSTTAAYQRTLEEYLACDESEPPVKRQRLEAQLNALGGLAAQFQAASVAPTTIIYQGSPGQDQQQVLPGLLPAPVNGLSTSLVARPAVPAPGMPQETERSLVVLPPLQSMPATNTSSKRLVEMLPKTHIDYFTAKMNALPTKAPSGQDIAAWAVEVVPTVHPKYVKAFVYEFQSK